MNRKAQRKRGGLIAVVLVISAFWLLLCSLGNAQTNPVYVTNIVAYDPGGVSTHYLYTFSYNSGMRIVDISDRTRPIDVGYRDNSQITALKASEGYAYRLIPGPVNIAFQILSLSNPTNPVIMGQASGTTWRDITLAGPYAYLSGNPSAIYDISNPATPVRIHPMPLAVHIAVLDNYAYFTSITTPPQNPNGIEVFDVSDPKQPKQVATVTMTNLPSKVVVSGDYMFVNSENFSNTYCTIFDISNRTNPVQVSAFLAPGLALETAGNYCYLGGHSFDVYDVSDPANPNRVASTPLVGTSTILRVGNYAYLPTQGKLAVYSLGPPPPPELKLDESTSSAVVLSWPTPAGPFVVQQKADPTPGNWVTVTDRSVVVAGRNRAVVPITADRMFFRLVEQ